MSANKAISENVATINKLTPKSTAPIGVILCNLGTPENYYPSGIRKYLTEFLTDRRVIEAPPRFLWWFVLHFIILRSRSKKLVYRYKDIWQEDGSPLLVISKQQAEKLATKLTASQPQLRVTYAFRYGSPNLEQRFNELKQQGVERFVVIPMYPQYSATTTAAVNDAVYMWGLRQRNLPEIRINRSFPTHQLYIKALANKIRQFWQQHAQAEVLLISFHGLPVSYIERGDPYVQECYQTANALAQELEMADDQYMITFQSRFGPTKWTQPYTIDIAAQLGYKNKSVAVVAPGFMVDCIETLDEIQNEIRLAYEREGGTDYSYIPCLNADDAMIDLLEDLTMQQLTGWL